MKNFDFDFKSPVSHLKSWKSGWSKRSACPIFSMELVQEKIALVHFKNGFWVYFGGASFRRAAFIYTHSTRLLFKESNEDYASTFLSNN